MLEAAAIVVDAAMLLLHLCIIFICPCACAKSQRLTTATMIVVDASMPVALCLYGTGVLTLDGAHHGNKATNSNSDYYYQIIIEVAQLRQHKQRLNDLRTQLG